MNKKIFLFLANLCFLSFFLFSDYAIISPQPIARSLSSSQLDVVISKSPTNSIVSIPAHLLAQKRATIQDNLIVQEMKLIIDDTRANIPECAAMSDVEIASLYIRQMSKSARDINIASTNTIDRIIGAGMRQDINKK